MAKKTKVSKKPEVGDRVKIGRFEGILMPRISTGDTNCTVLKLDNGYNIGIKKKETAVLEKAPAKKRRPAERPVKDKADISLLGCGGTIASKVEYRTGGVFPAISPSELLESVPELNRFGTVRSRKLFELFSEDMGPENWKDIAKETAKELKSSEGAVLMHGTDTMHYTSAALSFMLRNLKKPVVLVGSQRSSDRGSSDNAMNLECAFAAAKSDIAEVSVCMHGSPSDDYCYLHPGTRARKMHTSRRNAFMSIDKEPLAKVRRDSGKIDKLMQCRLRGKGSAETDLKMNGNVSLVYMHPGITGKFISSLSGFDGLVFAGTGLGHIPSYILKETEGLIKSGIPVAMAPQTIFGRINMNVYESGRKLQQAGAIGNLCDWTPETALVKLMWVLGHTKKMKKVEEMMLTNYAGEISERSDF